MKDEIREIIKKIIAYHICNDIPKGIDKDKVDEALEQIEALSSKNYTPKESVLADSYISDIIYATTQYLDIPDKDLAILNANIEKALLEAQENKEKEIDSLDKS